MWEPWGIKEQRVVGDGEGVAVILIFAVHHLRSAKAGTILKPYVRQEPSLNNELFFHLDPSVELKQTHDRGVNGRGDYWRTPRRKAKRTITRRAALH